MPQDNNRDTSTAYCNYCRSYAGRTESDEIAELKGIIDSQNAELKKRQRTIVKQQQDLQQVTTDEAQQGRMYKDMAAELEGKSSKVLELQRKLSVFKRVETTKGLKAENTLQRSQGGRKTEITADGLREVDSENRSLVGHAMEQVGDDRRRADEIISKTTEDLTTENSKIATFEAKIRALENALNDAEKEKARLHEEARTEREKADALNSQWNDWKVVHSSCDSNIEQLTDHASRITALETINRDLEEALEDLKGKYTQLQQLHLSCADMMAKRSEEASRIIALESWRNKLEHDLADAELRCRQWRSNANRLSLQFQQSQQVYLSNIQELEIQVDDQKRATQTARQRAEQLKSALDALHQTHSSTTELLNARTKELTLAQQFLTTADSIAGADVIRLVEKLNSEILQCAAQLADRLPLRATEADAMDADTNDQRIITAPPDFHRWVGEQVLRLLETVRGSQDPSIAVQIAVQAFLVKFCHFLIRIWHHSQNPAVECAFQNLYGVLRATVTTSIAVKWRALTKSNLDKLRDMQIGQDFASQVIDHMRHRLSDIVLFTGYPNDVADGLASGMSSNLESIAKSMLELRRMIGEKALFCDLDAFLYPPGTLFDRNVMVDSFETGRHPTEHDARTEAQPILCTTDLGLKQLKVGNVEEITLLPKVVLESVIGDLLPLGS